MSVILIGAMLFVPVFAADTPSEEEIREIFKDLGISTWGTGYFGCHTMNPEGDAAPDSVIHQYIQSANLLADYENGWEVTTEWGTYYQEGYELPYEKYIEIIDSAFVNHSDMKAFLNDKWNNYYNEETGMVKWGTGGFGGPTDWIVQEICYYSDTLIYATGVMVAFEYTDEDFIGKEENYDYVNVTGTFGSNKGMLEDALILTLQKEDGRWKILEFRENYWHIADGILYDLTEKVEMYPLEFNASGADVVACDDSKDFTTSFYGNTTKWFYEDAQLSYRISAKTGYLFDGVSLTDINGTKKLEAVDGVYVVAPEGKAVLTVDVKRNPVDIEISQEQENKTVKLSADNTGIFAVVDQSVNELAASINENVEVYNADGTKADSSDKIASGMQIVIKDELGNEVDFKTVVVPGDVDGDADIKAADARLALRASVGLENLSDWGSAAANVDGEADIKADDARNILRASVALDDSSDWLPSLS